ncbi:hypothetical protein QBC32DRAFT_30631 [Pseudoneurospora amorphoporcata]|uniref:Uncharacterized protein n=1 Tax=Pseudoneurospora amorphoporcata TaxID=241081 RepID=A0AAN6NPL5_9PEZI|nr:hypothetical protein QBC32DRAFT_30631 [Pseudoneurospora amorphoporcata]
MSILPLTIYPTHSSVNDFANSPASIINKHRHMTMARAVVEFAIESLRKGLKWLRDLAINQYEHSLGRNFSGPMRAKHKQRILLWHTIIEVLDHKQWALPRI